MRYVESLNQGLHRLLEQSSDVFLVGEDLLDPYGGAFKVAKGLSTRFPDRVLTTPISEAGLTGTAIGMAMRGFRPIVEIMFGDFLMLCADQIINHATKFSYMYNNQISVPITIRTPMGGYRGYGPTHSQTLEAMFLSVPNLAIVAPSHYHDPGAQLVHCVSTTDDPVLFVENKLLYPQQLLETDSDGRSGHFHVQTIKNVDEAHPTIALTIDPVAAPDVTLVAYGGMAGLATEAAYTAFMREEILVDVLLPSVISPVPVADLLPSVERSQRLVVLEEGVCHGGWGAEVACQVHSALGPRPASLAMARVGALRTPIPSAKSLEQQVLPSLDGLLAAITRLMQE